MVCYYLKKVVIFDPNTTADYRSDLPPVYIFILLANFVDFLQNTKRSVIKQ